jgi:tetratricopeptide (TPR) repeat protein
MHARRLAPLVVLAASAGAAVLALRSFGRGGAASAAPTPAERFHLGAHSRRVTTASPDAQKAFDRGLVLSFAFSHSAAEEEFRRAVEHDPKCAMAWWGIALVNGPHINFPAMTPEGTKKAWEALARAKALVSAADPVLGEDERALVAALSSRYAAPPPADRAPLDAAYADAMRALARARAQDADVQALCAEALMDLHPWDLWQADGSPQAWTPEVLETLERSLAADPKNPLALHLTVHAREASPTPEKGLFAADLLVDLVPGAGHLVHMPAHVYARVGRWADAAAANLRAIEADAFYRTQHGNPGFYYVYMAHNHHFLAFTAMMRGRSAEAIAAARAMVAGIPEAFLKDMAPVADGFRIFPSEALMRFGRWDDVLAEPEPQDYLPLSRAMWRFTRAVAANAKGQADAAQAERAAFREAATKVPKEWTFGNASAAAILAIAAKVLDGEIDAKAGRFDPAIATLREAVALEDALRYDEPPDWIQPVRHTLGAALMAAGKAADAEAVYRDDLKRWPENGWALRGLASALHAQGKHDESKALQARADRAWADADVKVTSTCLCLPGK